MYYKVKWDLILKVIEIDKRIWYSILTSVKTGSFVGKYVLLKLSQDKEKLNRPVTLKYSVTFEILPYTMGTFLPNFLQEKEGCALDMGSTWNTLYLFFCFNVIEISLLN